jgi:hypothetical protein
MIDSCKFCKEKCALVSGYELTCRKCDMEFIVTDTYHNQTYRLRDNEIALMSMHLDTNRTYIYFFSPTKCITIHGTFPDTKPEDALELARRLTNLKAFS